MLHEDAAPLLSRFLARSMDYTFLAILTALCDLWTGGVFFDGLVWFGEGVQSIPQVDYALFLSLTLMIGYFVIFHTLTGQTPGKFLCQIIVLQEGRRLPGVIWLIFATGGWLLVIMFLSARKRGLQDMISRTDVYQSLGDTHSIRQEI